MKKFAYIDAMRGIAILMVMAVHASMPVPGLSNWLRLLSAYGQTGVQLFFVASAYTLCLSHERRASESRPLTFYAVRRYFRIAPMYYLGIALYTTMSSYGVPWAPAYRHYTLGNILANVFFVHGFVPSANNNIVPGGWSIGTEMAFYAIFPILFVVAFRSSPKEDGARLLALLCVSLLVSAAVRYAILLATGMNADNIPFVSVNIVSQLPVFLFGMWAYSSIHRNTPKSFVFDVLGFTAAAGVAIFLILVPTELGVIFGNAVNRALFAFLLRLLRHVPGKMALLSSVGKASYSMYVLHFIFAWNIAVIMIATFPHLLPPNLYYAALFLFTIVATFALANVTLRIVEQPGIALGKYLIKRSSRHALAK